MSVRKLFYLVNAVAWVTLAIYAVKGHDLAITAKQDAWSAKRSAAVLQRTILANAYLANTIVYEPSPLD